MKARLQVCFGVILALLLCFSCTRPSFSVMDMQTEVSLVHYFDTEGSLTSSYESLSVFIESEDDANLQMEISSPDGLNTWLFQATKKIVTKQSYYGKAGLSIGERIPLPRGEWLLRVLSSDGRTIAEHFTLERGSEASSFQHHLDAETAVIVLDEQAKEYDLRLLDEKRSILFSTLTTEHTIDLTKLYPKWDKVRFVVLTWYDETAKQSQVAWYAL